MQDFVLKYCADFISKQTNIHERELDHWTHVVRTVRPKRNSEVPLVCVRSSVASNGVMHIRAMMMMAFPSLSMILGECSTVHSPPCMFRFNLPPALLAE